MLNRVVVSTRHFDEVLILLGVAFVFYKLFKEDARLDRHCFDGRETATEAIFFFG